ncbi:MAG: MBL fold metallo-hydrolase [Planctomycetota bacterium]|nr:MBL fold metallo-hydrolase [Planctomycetota bacterium]
MTVEYCVISIGALSHNRLWGESAPVRTAHATTTLLRDEERVILVDPSLPAPVLAARLGERVGVGMADVTDVFCTTLRPVHRRAVEALASAAWWTGELELESYRAHLSSLAESAERLGDDDLRAVEADLKLLERFQPVPDRLTRQVHYFPLPGASPGSAGLLLAQPASSILIAGDAALTIEHLRRGQIWQGCAGHQAARESLSNMLEVADLIIPGHDNITPAPSRWL